MAQYGNIEKYFREKIDSYYSTADLQRIIDEINPILRIGENAWHVKEMITRHFNYTTEWKIKLYILNTSWRPNQPREYAVIFHDNTYKYVDINGNFYTSIEEFLKLSNVVSYCTAFDRNETPFDDNIRFDYMLWLQSSFQWVFGEKGVQLLQKFVVQTPNAELKLKSFKFIFSFFSSLLHLNQDVYFVNEKNVVYVINNNIKCRIDFEVLENYQKFHDFNSQLKRAIIQTFEFNLDTVLWKGTENKIYYKYGQKERYVNKIEDTFCEDRPLGDKCQCIALHILKTNTDIRDPISLSEFIQIVYWVNILQKRTGLEITQEKIELYVEKLNDLLNAAQENENKTHKFVNYFSAAYHTNAHFEEFKSFHYNLGKSRWLKLYSNPILIDFLNEKVDAPNDMGDENER